MPPFPPVPNCLQVEIGGFVDGTDTQNWLNRLHFLYSGSPPSNTTCSAIATTISLNWGSFIASLCPSPTSLDIVRVTDLTSDTSGQGESLTKRNGTRGDDSIPANAAVLISYPSGRRFRGGHPRTYLMVGGNADLQGAWQWNTTFAQTEVIGAWRGFINANLSISSSGTAMSQLCWVSFYHGKDPVTGRPAVRPVPLVTAISVSEAVANLEMASQRGRIGRSARNRVGVLP